MSPSDRSATTAAPEARLIEIVFPDHTNHLGTLFGGQALAWMDKAAFVVATRYARRSVVTARSEQVDFRQPVRQVHVRTFKVHPVQHAVALARHLCAKHFDVA